MCELVVNAYIDARKAKNEIKMLLSSSACVEPPNSAACLSGIRSSVLVFIA